MSSKKQVQQAQQTQRSQNAVSPQLSNVSGLPVSNQERLEMINATTGQAGTGLNLLGIGNGLLQQPI